VIRSFVSVSHVSRIAELGQESLIHQLISLSHHKNIDTAFRATLRLRLGLSSVDYTTNNVW
jgi:hypothetical protein